MAPMGVTPPIALTNHGGVQPVGLHLVSARQIVNLSLVGGSTILLSAPTTWQPPLDICTMYTTPPRYADVPVRSAVGLLAPRALARLGKDRVGAR
eukprot:1794357-Prymnesium_polylepis.2